MEAIVRFMRTGLAILPMVALAGCASMNVDFYSAQGFEPQRYRTYAWGERDNFSTGDPRLDNNEVFDRLVRADVDRMLASKGFIKVTTGEPDLLVHYHANVTQEVRVREIDVQYGGCEDFDCRPEVYEEGTLFIDLVDPATNRLVWRGWAEGSVDGVIDNQALLERQVADAVAKIAEKLPGAM